MTDTIDYPLLVTRCMDRPDLAEMLLLTFRDSAPQLLAPVPDWFLEDRLEPIADAAHSLKGAAASIAAEALRAEAETLEHTARRGEKALCWAALERTVTQLRNCLRDISQHTAEALDTPAEIQGHTP